MQAWLRLAMVWLVALALPAQGMASVTMAHCGPSHQQMHAVSAASHHDDADGDVAPHHHDAATADGAAAQAAPSHGTATADRFTDLGKYKCSSCASCCSGIALLSVMPGVPAQDIAPTDFVEEVVEVDAFAADGPDRPPRFELA